ncbi:hypothetical protein [Desulfosporosinus sp. FKA]|uniref:hypothetical protein n=1 Tax=Desulfosporosinus sp. FKA TaxID=1969834 RepID=UPI000B49DBC4|nr:hypothetical protein [Desulfosporosinus sp. FKA]
MNYSNPPLQFNDPLGTDLALDETGDLIISPQGDLMLYTQNDNVLQMISTRVQTIPSTYIFGNDLGSDLGALVDEHITDDLQNQAFQAINAALIVDPRVIQVISVNVNKGDSQIIADIAVEIIGQGVIKTSIPIGGGSGV